MSVEEAVEALKNMRYDGVARIILLYFLCPDAIIKANKDEQM